MGDKLVVGCSTDEFNALKGKKTVIQYAHRLEILLACRYVDKVIPEYSWEQKRLDIEKESADIFAMGDDWVGKFDELSNICDVIYLPRTDNVSSSEIKKKLKLTNT
jgi:glycerol-3-phosphate cytidylyltransferase